MRLVKQNLDVLNDGMQQLRLLDAELSSSSIRAIGAVASVLQRVAQLRAVNASRNEEEAARVEAQLASAAPWRDVDSVSDDVETLTELYRAERQRLLNEQESLAERARARVKRRAGFEKLTDDQSHKVLRPIALAVTSTTVDALSPSLIALRDPFEVALRRAEDRANELLDDLIVPDPTPPLPTPPDPIGPSPDPPPPPPPKIVTMKLDLRGREFHSSDDVEALVVEIEKRLLYQLRRGHRVRLI